MQMSIGILGFHIFLSERADAKKIEVCREDIETCWRGFGWTKWIHFESQIDQPQT